MKIKHLNKLILSNNDKWFLQLTSIRVLHVQNKNRNFKKCSKKILENKNSTSNLKIQILLEVFLDKTSNHDESTASVHLNLG